MFEQLGKSHDCVQIDKSVSAVSILVNMRQIKLVFPQKYQHLLCPGPDQPLSYDECDDHGVHGQVEELVTAAPLQVVGEVVQDLH